MLLEYGIFSTLTAEQVHALPHQHLLEVHLTIRARGYRTQAVDERTLVLLLGLQYDVAASALQLTWTVNELIALLDLLLQLNHANGTELHFSDQLRAYQLRGCIISIIIFTISLLTQRLELYCQSLVIRQDFLTMLLQTSVIFLVQHIVLSLLRILHLKAGDVLLKILVSNDLLPNQLISRLESIEQ